MAKKTVFADKVLGKAIADAAALRTATCWECGIRYSAVTPSTATWLCRRCTATDGETISLPVFD